MSTNPAAPSWRRAVRPARLLPLVLPLLLTLAVIPLAQSGDRPAPVPPASGTTLDAVPAPAAGRVAPAATAVEPAPQQVVQPARQAPARQAQAPAAPRRKAARAPSRPLSTTPDETPDEDDAVDDALDCVDEATTTLGTEGC